MEPCKHLYELFGDDIALIHCKKCSKVSDKYVEFDSLLIFIDLLLHRSSAYRHLIYNRLSLYKTNYYVMCLCMMSISVFFESIAFNLYCKHMLNVQSNGYLNTFIFIFMHEAIRFLTTIVVSTIFIAIQQQNRNQARLKHESVMNADSDCLMLALSLSSMSWAFILIFIIWKYDFVFIFGIGIFVFSSNMAAIDVVIRNEMASFIATVVGWTVFIHLVIPRA